MFRIRDVYPGSGSASKNLSTVFLTQKTVTGTELGEKLSWMFWIRMRFFSPSRIQGSKSTRSRIRIRNTGIKLPRKYRQRRKYRYFGRVSFWKSLAIISLNTFTNILPNAVLGFGTWRAVADSIPSSRSFSQFTSASIRLVDVLDISRAFYLDPYFDAESELQLWLVDACLPNISNNKKIYF